MKEHDESYYEFKEIKENPVIIDFSSCRPEEIHTMLKEKFGFPEYYGRNLDALWDCLRDLVSDEKKYSVKIYGYNSLEGYVKEYCCEILDLFGDAHKEWENLNFKVIS